MGEMNQVPADALPSSRKLLRSTLIAVGVAALLLVTVVMPAEYGVDPTGVGQLLGLKRMGEIKMALAQEAAAEDAAQAEAAATGVAPANAEPSAPRPPEAAAADGTRTDTVSITLNPGQGREIKLAMLEGARVNFAWSTDRGVVNYDTHADSKDPPRDYYGYEKGQSVPSQEGVLVAAFDGMHGWFWRNRGTEPLTVTLRTTGTYSEITEVK